MVNLVKLTNLVVVIALLKDSRARHLAAPALAELVQQAGAVASPALARLLETTPRTVQRYCNELGVRFEGKKRAKRPYVSPLVEGPRAL